MGDESTRTREERQRARVRGKVARAAARIAPLFGALTVSLTAGCTAVLELEREQCAIDADCADLFPSATMVCIDKVCEQPACDTDKDCKDRGGPQFATSICSEAHQCVPGQCTDNSQCTPGICNVAQNRCVDRECQTKDECIFKGGESNTVSCVNGFCVDDMWGCIGKGDDRPVMASMMGTLKIPLLSSTDNTPIVYDNPATPEKEMIPPTWFIEVCPPPAVDPDCKNKIVTADKVIYDPATGIATVPGIPYNVPFRVKVDEIGYPPYVPKDPADVAGPAIVPMDFYTQKPVVGETTIPPLRVVSREGLNALIKAFSGISNPNNPGGGPVVNNALGNIYGLVFDCQSNPAADVALEYFDPLDQKITSATALYFNNAAPVLTAKWSFPTGIFSTLNLPTSPITVKTSLVLASEPSKANPDIADITKARVIRKGYSLLLQPLRMTTIHFHPRAY